jgi:SAM-dependent methyltransferase
MDLSLYGPTTLEQTRTRSLLEMLPATGHAILDVGARTGRMAKLLVGRFERVVALDLERPVVDDSRVECVKGNATDLQYDDNTFEVVMCAEVLEHIPSHLLPKVATEIARVASRRVLIGVPYKQDLRIGETICRSCGQHNPPWGHVNSFDQDRLARLFGSLRIVRTEFVGTNSGRTNGLSARLMRFAGNPYGTYSQEEACVHCGARLMPPLPRTFAQRIATRMAFWITGVQSLVVRRQEPNWMHVLFEK